MFCSMQLIPALCKSNVVFRNGAPFYFLDGKFRLRSKSVTTAWISSVLASWGLNWDLETSETIQYTGNFKLYSLNNPYFANKQLS